jgi:hypothetical protein
VRFTLRIVFDEDFEEEVLKVLCALAPESSQEEQREISLEWFFRLGESPDHFRRIPENLPLDAPEGQGAGFISKDWDIASEEQREWFQTEWRKLTEPPRSRGEIHGDHREKEE